MVDDIAVQEFVDAISTPPQNTITTYSGVVSRIDNQGVVWVRLAGANNETPTASTSAEVESGDEVTVEWRNNKLYIGGNYSNPSASVIRVDAVQQTAQVANQAATNAVADAGVARSAAQQAQATAEAVEGIAVRAEQSATDAQASAESANRSANTALGQLGIVEDVVGVLKLLSTNAEYQLTNDTEISEGKWYFTRSGYAGGSYSGSIATFETTAGDNIESLVVDIEPIQSGSGTPSLDNVRPISGRMEVNTIVSPTTSATDGRTYTTALGRTVYGGTLDVVSGVLTVDRAFRTFNGSENWETINQGLRYYGNFGGKAYSTKDVSNMLTYATSDPTRSPNSYTFTVASFVNVGVPYTVAEWKSLLATNNLQIVYELATPQTYQLTPQQVATLLGVNNVWADCGSVSVAVKSTYSYAVVTDPVIADIANYYEIVSIDEAVQDYVVSRLAVTSAGLWVQDPNMNTKILLSSTDGVVIYGPTGKIIGKYGSTAQVGDASSFHIEMDGTELGFYQGSQRVAYINNNQLYITQSVVLQQMDLGTPVASGGLGQWSWKVHPNGQDPSRNNLNLKWIG